jgi:hypothetical protein
LLCRNEYYLKFVFLFSIYKSSDRFLGADGSKNGLGKSKSSNVLVFSACASTQASCSQLSLKTKHCPALERLPWHEWKKKKKKVYKKNTPRAPNRNPVPRLCSNTQARSTIAGNGQATL